MDPQVDVLHGPRPVQKTGNVSVPRELLRAVGVELGVDSVHWALNPAIPGTIVLIPSKQVSRGMVQLLEMLSDLA